MIKQESFKENENSNKHILAQKVRKYRKTVFSENNLFLKTVSRERNNAAIP